MARRQNNPLRVLTEEERASLYAISRSLTQPAAHVVRAKALLAVSEGYSFSEAARRAGRRSGDAVSQLVARFNQEGIAAIAPRWGVDDKSPIQKKNANVFCVRYTVCQIACRMEQEPGRFRRFKLH